VTDPVILDPAFVEIGRNVVIGSGANIAGHCQLPDMILFRKTVIEDDVTIGANSTIFGGVIVRRGAMLGAGSVVPPYTTIGPGEYWHGVPAVKIRDMPPPQYLADEIGA
jgi:acetyltransferase-like isoleucine patch superfamily enzyme